ncbi:DNA/RNA-binding protein kin17-like [Plakobranchus ocellatus]|uniref:DNA/RNA-binding protein kin17-like n=1 Tax=Plakobranchus ocellatus TaxID=259542 RepID=A0AAV3ZG00_9GAST|nr:DNA/RNA-binding protein kin17-like [Plakobranchus ocellatus]
MNSTQWETLTEFVKYLGKEGKCIVDYTEKGWFVAYVDRDPETIRRQEALKAKEKMEVTDEERTMKFIDKQIERAKETQQITTEAEFTELKRNDEEERISLSLGLTKKDKPQLKMAQEGTSTNALAATFTSDVKKSEKSKTSQSKAEKRKATSALDEIMEAEEKKKERQNRKDFWLAPDIVVKVIHKRLGEKYYKKKAVVKEVKDLYTGIIKMLDSGDKLKVDQTHVETVIPNIGKTVMVVNGAYRGELATLDSIDVKNYCCTITIKTGLLTGRIVDNIQYEDISKIQS